MLGGITEISRGGAVRRRGRLRLKVGGRYRTNGGAIAVISARKPVDGNAPAGWGVLCLGHCMGEPHIPLGRW